MENNKQKIFMAVYEINDNKGGMTTAMLNRSKMFYTAGYAADIVTFDYNADYDKIRTNLLKSKKMDERTKIINMYEYFKKINTLKNTINKKLYKEQSSIKEKDTFECMDIKNKNVYRYFYNGAYKKYKKYDNQGQLKILELFNETKQRTIRYEFNTNMSVEKKITYDLKNNKMNSESFFTDDGFCYLVKWYNSESEKLTTSFLFDRKEKASYQFKNNNELATHWLTKLCIENTMYKNKPILICDGPGSLPKIIDIPKEVASRISFIHINHFEAPYKYGSKIKDNHRFIFERINELDALVILTYKQREDIEREFGKHENIFVIPNSQPIKPLEDYQKNKNKISMFTRLHHQKGLDRAIEMFKYVVDKKPQAKLEIFGKGSEEEKLNKLILKNNLQDHVQLMGYSKNVRKEMAQSILTILTSRYEAFGLSITESLETETPVVAFNCNYGPSDVIINNTTGYLIEDDNLEKMADKIVYLLENPDKAIEMGKAGRHDMIERFSDETTLQKWIDLFQSIQ